MNKSKKNSQRSQKSLELKYKFSLQGDRDLDKLLKLLENHTEPKLTVEIDGKRFSFNSKASRKKFLEGFLFVYQLFNKRIKSYNSSLKTSQRKLEQEKAELKNKLAKESEDYRIQKEIIKLRTLAWEDRLSELEQDREFLANKVKELRG